MPIAYMASSGHHKRWAHAVLIAVLVMLMGACSGGETVQGATEDLTDLDASHAAVALVSEGATDAESFAEAALELGIDFTCTSGGLPPYELCLVADDGVLAIVPLSGVSDQVVRLSDPGLGEDILVPMDSDEPVGVMNVGPRVRAQIEYLDEVVGELEGFLESLE